MRTMSCLSTSYLHDLPCPSGLPCNAMLLCHQHIHVCTPIHLKNLSRLSAACRTQLPATQVSSLLATRAFQGQRTKRAVQALRAGRCPPCAPCCAPTTGSTSSTLTFGRATSRACRRRTSQVRCGASPCPVSVCFHTPDPKSQPTVSMHTAHLLTGAPPPAGACARGPRVA